MRRPRCLSGANTTTPVTDWLRTDVERRRGSVELPSAWMDYTFDDATTTHYISANEAWQFLQTVAKFRLPLFIFRPTHHKSSLSPSLRPFNISEHLNVAYLQHLAAQQEPATLEDPHFNLPQKTNKWLSGYSLSDKEPTSFLYKFI